MRFEEDERVLNTIVPRRRLHHYFFDEHHHHLNGKKLFTCYKDLAATMLECSGFNSSQMSVDQYLRMLKNKQTVVSQWVFFRIPTKPETIEQVYDMLKEATLVRIKTLCPNSSRCSSCVLHTSCIEDPFNRRFKAVYGYIPQRELVAVEE